MLFLHHLEQDLAGVNADAIVNVIKIKLKEKVRNTVH